MRIPKTIRSMAMATEIPTPTAMTYKTECPEMTLLVISSICLDKTSTSGSATVVANPKENATTAMRNREPFFGS